MCVAFTPLEAVARDRFGRAIAPGDGTTGRSMRPWGSSESVVAFALVGAGGAADAGLGEVAGGPLRVRLAQSIGSHGLIGLRAGAREVGRRNARECPTCRCRSRWLRPDADESRSYRARNARWRRWTPRVSRRLWSTPAGPSASDCCSKAVYREWRRTEPIEGGSIR